MLINKFSQMTKLDILARSLAISLGLLPTLTLSASAEITATTGAGSTGTTFAPGATNTMDIQGGQKSSDNKNLFHSFGKFNVDAGQFANFKPDVGIQNILGRVTDGASLINGGIKVNGGSNTSAVNLFLMNPAGIVFGKGASLDINGAFTATTAKAIDFNGKWFNAFGANNYSELTGNPIGLAFTSGTPGSIFSAATFDASPVDPTKQTIKPGKSITLVGGTVISTGDIKTAGGNISIATVEGGKYVQIKVEGSILGLNLPASVPTYINSINSAPTSFKPQSLAELLTNTKVDLAATGVKIEKDVVTLVGNPTEIAADIQLGDTVSKPNRSLSSGDVITRNLDTSKINNGGNIYIESSQAILSGDINTQAKDSSINPRTFLGGTVVLNAQTELKVKQINTSISSPPSININSIKEVSGTYKGGNVILSTQTQDIIVDEIKTLAANDEGFENRRLSKSQSAGLLGGNVTIKSAGLFRVITTGGISSSLFGVINIKHGSKKPFASGARGERRLTGGRIDIPGFTFPDGASGSRGAIVTSEGTNGSIGVIYKDQSIDGISIAGNNNSIVTPPVKNDPDKNSGGGKTGTEVATNKSGDDSGEQDSTKDNSDNQASKPDDSEEDKQKAKKRKQKAKCNNSSAIASAKLGTDPTRSGNSANSAAEEFCPPNIDNGILQILTDRN